LVGWKAWQASLEPYLAVRSKIAQINGLAGPENVVLGNGSSEVFDNIFRVFLAPGEEVIQHTPCFGIYKLRCTILGGKLISVPMIYKDKRLDYDAGWI
jgi:histidinol-phosphate aminotransferase